MHSIPVSKRLQLRKHILRVPQVREDQFSLTAPMRLYIRNISGDLLKCHHLSLVFMNFDKRHPIKFVECPQHFLSIGLQAYNSRASSDVF